MKEQTIEIGLTEKELTMLVKGNAVNMIFEATTEDGEPVDVKIRLYPEEYE